MRNKKGFLAINSIFIILFVVLGLVILGGIYKESVFKVTDSIFDWFYQKFGGLLNSLGISRCDQSNSVYEIDRALNSREAGKQALTFLQRLNTCLEKDGLDYDDIEELGEAFIGYAQKQQRKFNTANDQDKMKIASEYTEVFAGFANILGRDFLFEDKNRIKREPIEKFLRKSYAYLITESEKEFNEQLGLKLGGDFDLNNINSLMKKIEEEQAKKENAQSFSDNTLFKDFSVLQQETNKATDVVPFARVIENHVVNYNLQFKDKKHEGSLKKSRKFTGNYNTIVVEDFYREFSEKFVSLVKIIDTGVAFWQLKLKFNDLEPIGSVSTMSGKEERYKRHPKEFVVSSNDYSNFYQNRVGYGFFGSQTQFEGGRLVFDSAEFSFQEAFIDENGQFQTKSKDFYAITGIFDDFNTEYQDFLKGVGNFDVFLGSLVEPYQSTTGVLQTTDKSYVLPCVGIQKPYHGGLIVPVDIFIRQKEGRGSIAHAPSCNDQYNKRVPNAQFPVFSLDCMEKKGSCVNKDKCSGNSEVTVYCGDQHSFDKTCCLA